MGHGMASDPGSVAHSSLLSRLINPCPVPASRTDFDRTNESSCIGHLSPTDWLILLFSCSLTIEPAPDGTVRTVYNF